MGHALSDTDSTCLGGRVPGESGASLDAASAGYIDHYGRLPRRRRLTKSGDSGVDTVEDGQEVEVDALVEVVHCRCEDRFGNVRATGIVDDKVEATKGRGGRLNEARPRLGRRDVGFHRQSLHASLATYS